MKLYFNKRNQKLTEKKNSSQAKYELEFAENNNVLCELLFTNDSLSTVAPSALSFGLFDSVDGNLLAYSNNFDYDTNILTIPLNTSELSAFLGVKVSRKAYAEFRFDWGEDTLTTLGLPARVFNTFLNGDEQPPSSLIFEYPTSSEFSELSNNVNLLNDEIASIEQTVNNIPVQATDTNSLIRTNAGTLPIVDGSFDSVNFGNASTVCYAYNSSILGGNCNVVASSHSSSVLGGENNTNSSSNYSSIVGGNSNSMCYAPSSLISGGNCNIINTSCNSSILGGEGNSILDNSCYSSIVGGQGNCVGLCSAHSSVVGGNLNVVNCSNFSSILGGQNNIVDTTDLSSILGGYNNKICIFSTGSSIVGGECNTASNYSYRSSIFGGECNIIDYVANSAIVGGRNNQICNSNFSFILGGENNMSCHSDSFIVGSNLTTSANCTTFVNNIISENQVCSKNLSVDSGTITASSPVSLNQTWNNAGVVFTGIKQNITDTASNSGSLLMDLQVGGVSNFRIKKDGGITTAASSNLDGGVRIGGGTLAFGYASDVVLLRPAANILSLRNSTNPQEFQIYGSYTNTTSYERMIIKGITSSNFQIGTEKGSGGGTARGLDFVTDGTVRWTVGTDGSFVASTPGAYVQISSSGAFRFGGSGSRIKSPSNGQITLYNAAESDFNLLQFGGNASNRPAIRRNGTSLDIVLADSSAFTNLYAKNLVQLPASTITPANNGEMVFEATSDTQITVKMKGSDGVVRSGTITLS